MSHRNRPALPAIAAAVLLASCGAGDDGADPTASPSPPSAPVATDPGPDDAEGPVADPTPTETPADTGVVIDLTVAGGEVTGAEDRVTVPLGEAVTLRVTADVDDEIHVHGYDHHADVADGEEATLTFTADIPGVFEVELEDSGVLLVRLEVR